MHWLLTIPIIALANVEVINVYDDFQSLRLSPEFVFNFTEINFLKSKYEFYQHEIEFLKSKNEFHLHEIEYHLSEI